MAVDRDRVLQAAQKLVEKKRYDKAIVEYQRLVVDDPKDVRTLLKIGDLYLKMEQHADAIATYERVGQFYSTQGFHLKAIAVYKQIREIVHKHVPHLEDRFGHIVPKLAETYAQLGLTSDALAAYDEVATRYQRAGRDRDAIDVFRKVVDLDPQNPLPHLRLAEAFMRVKDVDSAIQRFGLAAEILLKLGRNDDALKVLERLLQHRLDAKFARTAAEIYLERGEPSDAMAALSKLQICFKENPKDLGTLALLARSFDKLGQPAKSIEVQKEAARIAKDAGKPDHFSALVESLLSRAPNDEGVRQLAAMRKEMATRRAAEPPPPPAQSEPPPGSVTAEPASAAPAARVEQPSAIELEVDEEIEAEEEDDVGVVLEEDDAASEKPFALQHPSRPPGPLTADAPAPEPNARLRKFVQQIDAYRHAKDYDHAVARVFEALEIIPESRELREKLCDVLIEAGDQVEAVRQMLAFAQWLAAASDVESATRILDEVLLLEPGHPEAVAQLRGLGYTISVDEPVPGQDGGHAEAPEVEPEADGADYGLVSIPDQDGPSYDPSAPLPSYDLEEVSAADAMNGAPARAFAPSQLDDPFGEGGFGDAPLPSFALEDEAAQYPEGRVNNSTEIAVPAAPAAGGASGQLDEEALEEVEFFASNSMFDEARNLLEEQLHRLPNHPLLLERLREIEEHAAAAVGDGSGTRAVPRNSSPLTRTGSLADAFPGEDKGFDIAASLDALDALDAGPQDPAAGAPGQVTVEQAFEQFKAGVAEPISESDAATHYDLGAAYKEMGLVTDAIAEFELASRDPGRECVCLGMIGMIHREQGNVEAAIHAFVRGLHAQVKTPDQELALTYEIGDCYEERRALDQALFYFQRVARMNPDYVDMRGSVAERVHRLEPAPMPMPKPAAMAVGADTVDEFDAVLDDLLGGTKLP